MENPFRSVPACYDGEMRLIKMSETHCPGCGQPFIVVTQEDGMNVVGCETCGHKLLGQAAKSAMAEIICLDMAVPA